MYDYNTKDRQKQICSVKYKDRKQKGRTAVKRKTDRRKRKQINRLNYLLPIKLIGVYLGRIPVLLCELVQDAKRAGETEAELFYTQTYQVTHKVKKTVLYSMKDKS
jgi:hypothetical protein